MDDGRLLRKGIIELERGQHTKRKGMKNEKATTKTIEQGFGVLWCSLVFSDSVQRDVVECRFDPQGFAESLQLDLVMIRLF